MRAVPERNIALENGGHAALCPPYKARQKGESRNSRAKANSPKSHGQIEREGCHAHRSIVRRLAWLDVCLDPACARAGQIPQPPGEVRGELRGPGGRTTSSRACCATGCRTISASSSWSRTAPAPRA